MWPLFGLSRKGGAKFAKETIAKSPFHYTISNESTRYARYVCRVSKSKMAYRDEIDDAFDAVVFLEERYVNNVAMP